MIRTMSTLLPQTIDEGFVWKIKLFGGLAVLGYKRKITRFRTRKSAALLAYLSIRRGPQPREVLIDMFWPEADPEAGRHNLSNALSSLRLVLEPVGVISGSVIESDRFNVGLNPRSVSTDALDFEESVNRLLNDRSPTNDFIPQLEEALNLYQGPLLPGFYEDWVTPESVRLDSLFKEGVARLTDLLLADEQFEKAVHWAQLGLKNDPLDEGAILVLLTALEKLSRYSDAIRAYRRFCENADGQSLAGPSKKLHKLAQQIEERAHESDSYLPQWNERSAQIPAEANLRPGEIRQAPESSKSKEGDLEDPSRNLETNPRGPEKSELLGDEFFLRTMTRFFGRRHEMAKLAKMLSVPRTRLITITGPGGIGKTRFAIEAIAEIAEGAFGEKNPFVATFVSLSDVTDSSKLFDRVVRALAGEIQDREHSRDSVVRVLNSQASPILILDNFEQLVDEGAALVRNLLARSPKLRVIVTSRQRLRLNGEQVFTLTSLATPQDSLSLEELAEFPSVGLFIDRAEAASVNFQIDERNIGLISRLCSILEGVPMAIELAAARVSSMSIVHIVAEVEKNRLDFLTTNSQDAVPRHQTIRATVAWSFKLLKDDAKRLLCALSTFRSGWTIQAAQAISGLATNMVESILTDLRDFSLITVTDTEDGLRFWMAEVIREFAAEECLQRRESEEFAALHANYFATFAEQTIPGFLSPAGVPILRQFRVEQANLLAAKTWADSHSSNPVNQRIGMAIIRFWLSVSWDTHINRVGENAGTTTLQSTLGLLIPLGGPMEPSSDPDEVSTYLLQLSDLFDEKVPGDAKGWILVQLGYTNLGRDLVFARTAAEKGVALMRQIENKTALAHALNALAVISSVQGEYNYANSLNQESYSLLAEDRVSKTYDFAVHTEGIIAFMAGDHKRGEECLKQNLAYARQSCDTRSEFAALYILGRVYNEIGRFSEGLETLMNASQVSAKGLREVSYLSGYLSCFLGYSHFKLGDITKAVTLFKDSLYLFRESKRTQGFSMTLFFLAEILASQKQFKLSAKVYGASEMFRLKHGRALDHRELEWDRDIQRELRSELESIYQEQFELGLAISEEEAFNLAIRAFDSQKQIQ